MPCLKSHCGRPRCNSADALVVTDASVLIWNTSGATGNFALKIRDAPEADGRPGARVLGAPHPSAARPRGRP